MLVSLSCCHKKLSSIGWTPIRYVTLHLRDQRGAAVLRYWNRTEITVLMREQKPYPEWFSCRRKSPGGGGDSAYQRGGDARRKFWIKLLKETNLGVARAFFDP